MACYFKQPSYNKSDVRPFRRLLTQIAISEERFPSGPSSNDESMPTQEVYTRDYVREDAEEYDLSMQCEMLKEENFELSKEKRLKLMA